VVPERIDVLRSLTIRFTPLNGTNDLFETRRMFDKLVGPHFASALAHELLEHDLDEECAAILAERTGLDLEAARRLAPELMIAIGGADYQRKFRTQLIQEMLPQACLLMNSDACIEHLLGELSKNLVLSLTEDSRNELMWAHYAATGHGFVIEFDADDPFFYSRGGKNCLHKVNYSDEVANELIEDPEAALLSKGVRWGYEQEWRLFRKVGTENALVSVNGENIHLFELPTSAIRRVILGPRATNAVERSVIELAQLRGWGVKRYLTRPFSNFFIEEDLEIGVGC
jgi:hypothetical protein